MQHFILALIMLLVALVSVISVFRQLKFKNMLALVIAALSAVTFGFFSIATIIDTIKNGF
ncbi:DUF2759 family protein [Virgibacillus sp. 179-BFC.A HS]|uniref:DUF2759 family protein n=1 Tax=Tigheibacillus jepli TaxID=3035914 RepID=A0ABU5CJA1_9BACI|nr:DUF2759 family protein [Virgibacillus sp. 179-BFC.A HS]MDY0405580.1 DUF2759 family protein [Virgibacillus sp. 179-BFC.A HS]